MRIVKRTLLGLFALLGAVLVLALLGTLIPNPFVYDDGGAARGRRILVVGNTIHTDIAIPIGRESLGAFDFLAGAGQPVTHPQARWLLFGWGGRSFYLETPSLADIKPGPTFRALTLDSSVMHVDVLAGIDETDPAVTPLVISEPAYANLLAAIARSFARRDGRVEPIAGFAYGTVDRFYEAEGGFNALLGCNVWTSRMLREAGVRTGLWDPLPLSLTTSLALFEAGRVEAARATAP